VRLPTSRRLNSLERAAQQRLQLRDAEGALKVSESDAVVGMTQNRRRLGVRRRLAQRLVVGVQRVFGRGRNRFEAVEARAHGVAQTRLQGLQVKRGQRVAVAPLRARVAEVEPLARGVQDALEQHRLGGLRVGAGGQPHSLRAQRGVERVSLPLAQKRVVRAAARQRALQHLQREGDLRLHQVGVFHRQQAHARCAQPMRVARAAHQPLQ